MSAQMTKSPMQDANAGSHLRLHPPTTVTGSAFNPYERNIKASRHRISKLQDELEQEHGQVDMAATLLATSPDTRDWVRDAIMSRQRHERRSPASESPGGSVRAESVRAESVQSGSERTTSSVSVRSSKDQLKAKREALMHELNSIEADLEKATIAPTASSVLTSASRASNASHASHASNASHASRTSRTSRASLHSHAESPERMSLHDTPMAASRTYPSPPSPPVRVYSYGQSGDHSRPRLPRGT